MNFLVLQAVAFLTRCHPKGSVSLVQLHQVDTQPVLTHPGQASHSNTRGTFLPALYLLFVLNIPVSLNCCSPNMCARARQFTVPLTFWSLCLSSDSPTHVACSQHRQTLPGLESPSRVLPKGFFPDDRPIGSKKHKQQDSYTTLPQTGRNSFSIARVNVFLSNKFKF